MEEVEGDEPQHPVDEDTVEDSSAVVITYLRQLIRNYEDLVQDMSKTLTKNRDEFATVQRELQADPSPTSSTSSAATAVVGTEIDLHGNNRRAGGRELLSFCQNCENAQKLISNLTNQVESLTKAKKLTTTLWHSSAEQIEQLENRLKNKLMSSDTAMKTSTESQIKLFQSYITRLEGRLEQTSFEKNFYRRKLMESKLEKEAVLKDVLIEKQTEIELIKTNYNKEIEHLKQNLEKERQVYLNSLEKRLEDERKVWTKEEKERRDNLKQTWLSQLKPLVLEQETLLYRESQLSEKLYQTQLELYQAKQLLWFAPHQQQDPQQPQIQAAVVPVPVSAGSGQASSLIPLRQHQNQDKNTTTSVSKPNEKVKFIDLNYDYPTLEKYDEDPTWGAPGSYRINRRTTSRQANCDHEECVQYSMHQQVLNENEKLGEEISRLQRSKHMIEAEQRQHASRLEQRIRDLEHLNYNLQLKLLNPNEAFTVLDRPRGETRDDNFIFKQSQRSSNTGLKARPGPGSDGTEDPRERDRNNYNFIFAQSEEQYQHQQHPYPNQQEIYTGHTGDVFLHLASQSSHISSPHDYNTQNNNMGASTRSSRTRQLIRPNDKEAEAKHNILSSKRSSSSTRERDRDRDSQQNYFTPIILNASNHNNNNNSNGTPSQIKKGEHHRVEQVEHYSREIHLRQKFFDEQRRILREKSLVSVLNGIEEQG